MKDIHAIREGVLVLLQRVRSKNVGLDGIERGLEVILHDLQQLNVSRPPCAAGHRFGYEEAVALRRDIDARTIKR